MEAQKPINTTTKRKRNEIEDNSSTATTTTASEAEKDLKRVRLAKDYTQYEGSNEEQGGGLVSDGETEEADADAPFKPRIYPPAAPVKVDAFGRKHYVGPIPGFDHTQPHLPRDLIPHITYMYVGDRESNDYGGKQAYQQLWEGTNMAPRIQFCDWDRPLRAPFGMVEGKSKDGKPSNDPNRQNLDLAIEDDPDLDVFVHTVDWTNAEVCVSRRNIWWRKGIHPDSVKEFQKPWHKPPTVPEDADEKKRKKIESYSHTVRGKVVLEDVRDPKTDKIIVPKTQVLKLKDKKKTIAEDGSVKWDIKVSRCDPSILAEPNIRVVPIGEMRGMWFQKEFGQRCQFTRVVVCPHAERNAVQFIDTTMSFVEEEEEEEEKGAKANSTTTSNDHPGDDVGEQQPGQDVEGGVLSQNPYAQYLSTAVPLGGGEGTSDGGNEKEGHDGVDGESVVYSNI